MVARSSFLSVLLVLLALLKAVATTRLSMSGDTCATLNQALRGAAQLHLQFGVPLVLGLVIGGFLSGSQQPSVIHENHSGCTAEAIGDGSTTCAAAPMAGDFGRSHRGERLEAIQVVQSSWQTMCGFTRQEVVWKAVACTIHEST